MMYAASAFATNTIIRSAVGAAFPLFTVQMYHKVRYNFPPLLFPIPFIALLVPRRPSSSCSSTDHLFFIIIARNRLGIYPHRLHRPRTRSDTVLVLQVRSEN